MELLEAFQIRTGRNNQLLRGADEYSFRIWNILYICLICHDAVLLHKKSWCGGDPVAGWPSLVCIILFISGLQFLCIGIMGKYIAKTYMETKGRPHYIISDTNKDDVNKIN